MTLYVPRELTLPPPHLAALTPRPSVIARSLRPRQFDAINWQSHFRPSPVHVTRPARTTATRTQPREHRRKATPPSRPPDTKAEEPDEPSIDESIPVGAAKMNGSFESPSHLERRIRAEIEDVSDSSLSTPGFGRRAKSESLSFLTDEGSDEGGRSTQGSYQQSTQRILPDLSELSGEARTTSGSRSSHTVRRQPTVSSILNRQDDDGYDAADQDRKNGTSTGRSYGFDGRRNVSLSTSRHDTAGTLITSTSTDASELDPSPAEDHSLPLTSTPHKGSNTQHTQTTFYSQKSGNGSLARRAAETSARHATRPRSEGWESDGTAWSEGTRETAPTTQENSRRVNNTDSNSSLDLAARSMERDVNGGLRAANPLSADEDSVSLSGEAEDLTLSLRGAAMPDDLATEEIRPRDGVRRIQGEEGERKEEQSMASQQRSSGSQTPPISPAADKQQASIERKGLATPRAALTADRMKSYVMSSVKDPVREQRIMHSIRRTAMGPQRIRAQRVQVDPNDSDITEEGNFQSDEAQTPKSGFLRRGGPSSTLSAGRTPRPFRPSHLVNDIGASDTSSQASGESSTYDLMTPARGWANTSLPGLGVAEGNVQQLGNRIDPQKLSRHLHKLNEGLLDENAELKEAAASSKQEADSLRRQLNAALREKESLVRQMTKPSDSTEPSPAEIPLPPSPTPEHDVETQQALQEAAERIQELEGHKEELNDMLDALEQEHEKLAAENENLRRNGMTKVSAADETIERQDQSWRELEKELQIRDHELERVRGQLLASEQQRAALHAEIEEAANFAMQQVGTIEDERDAAWKDLDKQKNEVQSLRQQIEQLKSTAQNVSHGKRGTGDNSISQETPSHARLREELEKDLETASEYHARECAELEETIERQSKELQSMDDERKQLDIQLHDLAQEVDDLKDELDRQRIAVEEKQNQLLRLTRQPSATEGTPTESAEIEKLQAELLEARKTQNSRAYTNERELLAKDSEIKALRRQKQGLEERLESYKQQVLISTNLANATAGGVSSANATVQTPAKHRNILNVQTAVKTPASPGQLASASWLNDTTVGNASVVEHIKQLEELLASANAQLDEKLGEIDRQGIQHLKLTKQLFGANDRVEELESELDKLIGSSSERDRMVRALRRIRCTSCKSSIDATSQVRLPWSSRIASTGGREHGTGPVTGTEDQTEDRRSRSLHRDQALAEFVEKIPQLTARLAEVEEENRVLRDAQGKVNKYAAGSKVSKDAAQKLESATRAEMNRARAAIIDLGSELREERRRLPELAQQSKAFGDLSEAAERDLTRTETRLRSVEADLRRRAAELAELRKEFGEKSSVGNETNAQMQVLEMQVKQAVMDVEQLQQDKASIFESRNKIYDRFRVASERYASVQSELSETRKTVAAHQDQIDQQTASIARLHATLKTQNDDIHRLTGDRDRLHAQRQDILRDVSTLEADLRRVRGESQRFASDLETLRREREEQRRKATVARETSTSITAEAQETIVHLKNRLEQAQKMIKQLENGGDETVALRQKHAAECKGLLVQIRYLKTKFMRESDLRQDLAFQKSYLLQIVGGLDLGEKETVRFLADLAQSRGRLLDEHSPIAADETIRPPHRKVSPAKAKLRKALTVVLATSRMKLMAHRWRQTRAVREAIVEAHSAARKRRDQRFVM